MGNVLKDVEELDDQLRLFFYKINTVLFLGQDLRGNPAAAYRL